VKGRDKMRTSIKYVLIFFAAVIFLGLTLTLVSGDSEARTCVWDGESSSALASNATNWDTNVTPIADDSILFNGLHLVNASADDPCTWDLSNNSFGTFTIDDAYSGTITQSSDMYITGYSQAGGTLTGSTSYWFICSGDFIHTSGSLGSNKVKLHMTGDNSVISVNSPYYQVEFNHLWITNHITLTTGVKTATYNLLIDSLSRFTINANVFFGWGGWKTTSTYENNGIIDGAGIYQFYDDGNLIWNLDFGYVLCNTWIMGDSSPEIYVFTNDAYFGNLTIFANGEFLIVDLNGHSLTATSIVVGNRGILQCGEGTITTGALTSTAGTITEETATWVFTNATVTATSGEKFYNVHINGWCDFVSSVNITNELRFINVPSSYDDIDVYLDSVYELTLSSNYSFGTEITAAAKYEYLPDIQIAMSQFYEDVDFSIYAYISCNLPVTYNITGTASGWLSYHEGCIVGMPPDIGNYTYTITATHASGGVDIINGYIPVGNLDTAEYNFDFIWGLLLWTVISLFMLFAFIREIPLMQMVVWVISFGNIIATIRIDNFEAFVALFAICNTIMFFIGMARWRS
jgi:hypothetical protein